MKRIESIDALRGLSIFMMVLCAAISWEAGLPAWMFHCQTPPPDYAFHPEVRGITWVDMVFPIFLFSMGAAFPFALGRKLEKGESISGIIFYLVKRCAILAGFAIALGNSSQYTNPSFAEFFSGKPVEASIWRGALWLAFFASLVRTDRKWLNPLGWLTVAGLMAFMNFGLKVEFNFLYRDEIIMILAHVALLGGLIWLLTREGYLWRILVLIAVIAVKACAGLWPEAFLWLGPVQWMQYLVIALPASLVGDLIVVDSTRYSSGIAKKRAAMGISVPIIIVAVGIQFWGLYMREVVIDLIVTSVMAGLFVTANVRRTSVFSHIGYLGFAMLLCGIGWDFVDGGLAKDFCNLSYLLVSGGIASLVLCIMIWAEQNGVLSRNFVYAGQNPMIAYTVAGYVISPILYGIGFAGWFDALCVGSPWLGLCRGLIVTFLMMAFTCAFTKCRIFWRS